MKHVKTGISVVAAMLFALSTTAMAAKDAYFVKVDRETTTEASKQKPKVKAQMPKRDKSSGMATGKRQHKPVVVTKPVDKNATKQKPIKLPKTKSGDITLKRG